MRLAVKVIGLAVTVATIILIAFLGSMIYSLYTTFATGEAVYFGDVDYELSDGSITLIIPVYVNNTGLYDMTDINITTVVVDGRGNQLSCATTTVPVVKRDSTWEGFHELTISLSQIVEKNLTYLLFEEADLYTDVLMSFTYAKAVTFGVSVEEIEVPWGPPLYGLNVTDVTLRFEDTTPMAEMWIYFENRSPIDLVGALTVELRNADGTLVATGTSDLNAPSWTTWSGVIRMPLEDVDLITPEGEVWLYVTIGGSLVGPIVIPYSGLGW